MNINIFLSIVMVGLAMIYFFFKPMNLKETTGKEIAQFSLGEFTLNELDSEGLVTKMNGESAVRYSNRYEVSKIDFTDNSKEYLTNMKANKGTYKRDIVFLNGDVKLNREDGLSFFSQKAKYDKNKDIASTDTKYIAYMNENYMTGNSAVFDNKNKTIKSKKIHTIYKLEEKK